MNNMESPEYMRMSLAAAMTLGFKEGRFYRGATLPCVNLLLTYDEGCVGACSYCGLSRKREGDYPEKSFIRVSWPTYETDDIVDKMLEKKDKLKRVCISMVTNKKAVHDTIDVTERIRAKTNLPISLLITPTLLSREDLVNFKKSGAEMIGVAVDAVTPELFDRHRGKGIKGPHRWEKYWDVTGQALEIFGEDMVGVHLIVGLGETEREMAKTIQKVKDMGARTHLFSFFPEEGSKLEKHSQPPAGQFRRMQFVRFLVDECFSTEGEFVYDENDRVVAFGLNEDELNLLTDLGTPFMTSGCPDEKGEVACNRPYGDSMPGPDIRSFPFWPKKEDVEKIRTELETY
ncbi:radical SAM protein [candidate division TA06 bacterium]|uniref:Radical SAM protein n=1 Tax=candidate division TA06 bacterium TaxID=2250710 RepID=A0A523UUY0_UNCT6|nr:MAG: radical SAM protein [candidate division TA06 bacterium]